MATGLNDAFIAEVLRVRPELIEPDSIPAEFDSEPQPIDWDAELLSERPERPTAHRTRGGGLSVINADSFDLDTVPDVFDVASAVVDYAVPGLIPAVAITMITADSGAGKSTGALNLAINVSMGSTFAGSPVAQRAVLYLDLENPADVVAERLHRFNLTRTPPGLKIVGTWLDVQPPDPCGAAVLTWILRQDPKPLIVLDSLVAFMRGGDENDASAVREFMHRLRLLAASGAAVVILHHAPKSKSQPYRGSSDLLAAVDVAYELSNLSPGSDLTRIGLRCFKRRYPVLDNIILEWDAHECEFRKVERNAAESNQEICERILKENPGITKVAFGEAAKKAGAKWHRALAFLASGVEAGTIEEIKAGRSLHYTWTGGSDAD